MRVLARTVGVIVGATLAAGCGSSRTATTTTTATTSSGVTLTSPRVQQIALARASSDLFSIFPARAGTKRCTIPGGGLRTTPLRGNCTTRIRYADTHEPELLVSFTETWAPAPCPPGAFCPVLIPQHHTWTVVETEPIVTTTAHLRIAATRQSGSTAPQFYK
jgi:hypothetical protein